MLNLLKVFGRGILVTVLLPFILIIWVLYAVYCIGLFIFMFFKSTIEYFQGKTFNAELPEDIEARRILLEKEKTEEQAKEALKMMYQGTMTQIINPPDEENTYKSVYDNNQQNDEPHEKDDYYESYGEEEKTESFDDEYGDDLDDLRGN